MKRIALFALALIGCSGRLASNADAGFDPWLVDAPDLDAATDASTLCEVTEITNCEPSRSAPVLFDAKAIGARIVALRPPYALLDPPRVLSFDGHGTVHELVASGEEATFRATAFAVGPGSSVYALLCGDEACGVVAAGLGALARMGAALPSSTRTIAVVDGWPWVAGDGVRRFDGTAFHVELDEGHFDVMAAATYAKGETLVVAAGSDGRVAVRARGAWSWLSLPSADPILSASTDGSTIALVGESGAIYFGTASTLGACTGVPLAASWAELSAVGPGALVGVTRDARPFAWQRWGATCVGAPTPGLTLLAHSMCGLARNEWRAIDDVLYGTTGCALD